ncbi:hypothetical protein jhhlp_003184 [Lomentospora prolificans]|uniref:Formamidopyrimidine-DNA glycosylase catalytic domain-containing protein n=1 Tax=Lomentospora prolificans TaxID=41688 RepID=A0A2N3NGA2_9PEZI|nr:hypothetical protein jhhlp_003184 [Lomentospora prolificans]
MPEIAEVARIVHFLRLHLVGKTISKVVAVEDTNVFGKAGTSGPEIESSLNGKKVLSAGSQGKYFWITFDKPPHVVMHFGMTGWIHIKDEKTSYTSYYNKLKAGEADQWPPKFWKFQLETNSKPPVKLAFTDPRRLGRVRLVDCPSDEIRKNPPLVENGPDPVVDKDIFTEEFLRKKVKSRRVPIKALLLDQKFLSGIGNWVGDEVLYHARLHPEQYSDEFSDEQIKKLYASIVDVCQTAVDKLGDSDKFPEHWLFNHRWSKGKGASLKLPNGHRLEFLTVGGRTSCYAPDLQKKNGKAAAKSDIKEEDEDADAALKVGKANKTKITKVEKAVDKESTLVSRRTKSSVVTKVEVEEENVNLASEMKRARVSVSKEEITSPPAPKRQRKSVATTSKPIQDKDEPARPEEVGRRRSGRLKRV